MEAPLLVYSLLLQSKDQGGEEGLGNVVLAFSRDGWVLQNSAVRTHAPLAPKARDLDVPGWRQGASVGVEIPTRRLPLDARRGSGPFTSAQAPVPPCAAGRGLTPCSRRARSRIRFSAS